MTVIKKIVLLGDSAVGKTSLIRRYVFNQFDDSYIATIGTKVTKKDLKIPMPNRTEFLTLVIWDIIGREGYYALHTSTFVGVHGALLVADLTRKETLMNLERYWIPILFKVVDNVPLIFACNKSDLEGEYEFDPKDLADIAARYNEGLERVLPLGLESNYSTSAKNGGNVEKSFESLGHFVLGSEELTNPVKELYGSLVAMGVRRSSDKTTPIGALDAIIVDFCEGFKDSKMAMVILRQEIVRAGVDIKNPTKEGIVKVVEYLADVENELLDEKTMTANLERRKKLTYHVK